MQGKCATMILVACLGTAARATAADPLDAAKALYRSASYEAALVALNSPPPESDADEVDQYRALCLLGLNRAPDAQLAIDRLVARHPLMQFDESESPKVIAMYRDARSRLLPPAAKSLYASAKANFERGDLTAASAQFHDVSAILSSADLAKDPSLADLKMLADGFLKLTEQASKRAAVNLPPAPEPKAEVAVATAPSSVAIPATKIFSGADTEVVAPVAVVQNFPKWNPPPGVAAVMPYSGLLEVVVNETGGVDAAVISRSVFPPYDRSLLAAAKTWQYVPAKRNGQPVKYRKVIEVVLSPGKPLTQ
jgi:TonB family protein